VHPDVRRMLMRQKVLNEGMRALGGLNGNTGLAKMAGRK